MKYHLYAVGNALLDFEFQVTEAQLKALNVDKGVMTLIDADRHQQLMQDLSSLHHLKASGGSAANSVATAQVLGGKTFFSGRVANDDSGHFYRLDFNRQGTQTNFDHENKNHGVTGKCIALITPDADRSMNTFLGINTNLSPEDLNETAIQQSYFVYIEGYLITDASPFATALAASQLAKKHGVKCATTLSDPNMVLYFKDNLKQLLQDQVDLLFCNEKEALIFCDTENLEEAKQILKQYAKTYVITLGSEGSITFDGETYHSCPAAPLSAAKVVDTMGAGDTFAGSFMYALAQGYSYAKANQLANIAAARVVCKFGPRLNAEDATYILEQFKKKQEVKSELV